MNSTESSSQANFLALLQKDPDCYFSGIRIDFTKVQDHSASTKQGEVVYKKIIPSFNKDGLYFTDSFILEKGDSKTK